MEQGHEDRDRTQRVAGFPRHAGQSSEAITASGAALAAALGGGTDIPIPPRLDQGPEPPMTAGPRAPNVGRAGPRSETAPTDDVFAIGRLKFRYLRSLDTKQWDELVDTMIPEATATYSEYLQFESRDAFLTFVRNTLGPHVITEHHCDHPEIDVDGDTATGTWYLSDTALIPEHNMLLHGAAFYSDRYVRCDDGRWRIAHTGYERTYEVVLSLDDLPSLRLTSNRLGLIVRDSRVEPAERQPGENLEAEPVEVQQQREAG